MKERYDCLCIGSGPGGYSAALRLSCLGKSVAVIDYSKDNIGGVCLNEGCIPVKAIIKISKMYSELKRKGTSYGFAKDIDRPDMKRIVAYSKDASRILREGLLYLFKKNNIVFIEQEAELLEDKKIRIGKSKVIGADNIIIATGSKPNELPQFKFDGERIISSKEAINLDYIPDSILILGAGAIGLEFASIFCDLGTKVTLIEIQDQILPGEDKEIALRLESIFKKRGIELHTECEAELVEKGKDKIRVSLKGRNKKEIEVSLILLAVGRSPNIDKDSFTDLGIEMDNNFVKVDEYMMTTSSGIYAVGDITAYPMFAHSAYKEAEIASLHIAGKRSNRLNREDIPKVIYSNPEVASIGLSEDEVRMRRIGYRVLKKYYRANPYAVLSGHQEGFIKIIVDDNHNLLGAHILGYEASELIHQFAICKSNNLSIDKIDKTIYAHPTFSEIIKEASSSLLGERP